MTLKLIFQDHILSHTIFITALHNIIGMLLTVIYEAYIPMNNGRISSSMESTHEVMTIGQQHKILQTFSSLSLKSISEQKQCFTY